MHDRPERGPTRARLKVTGPCPAGKRVASIASIIPPKDRGWTAAYCKNGPRYQSINKCTARGRATSTRIRRCHAGVAPPETHIRPIIFNTYCTNHDTSTNIASRFGLLPHHIEVAQYRYRERCHILINSDSILPPYQKEGGKRHYFRGQSPADPCGSGGDFSEPQTATLACLRLGAIRGPAPHHHSLDEEVVGLRDVLHGEAEVDALGPLSCTAGSSCCAFRSRTRGWCKAFVLGCQVCLWCLWWRFFRIHRNSPFAVPKPLASDPPPPGTRKVTVP